jgi:hypothetical protein
MILYVLFFYGPDKVTEAITNAYKKLDMSIITLIVKSAHTL